MTDARFEDGAEAPLRLIAQDAEDVPVLASLLQDAVFPITEMRFDPKARRFALLLNRFRWEDRAAAEAAKRPYERVRSLLVIEDILRLRSTGIDRSQSETILSLLTLTFAPGPDGTGILTLTLAGDGAVQIEVETVSLRLDDVTRPYIAPSGKAPDHG
ncbi:DUF2948 family protein [Pseudorhodobacter sp. MZDSW-24AT]|uniref:DUF2948 family protein n=1 Tax=Pseudorhodobacter sp. MZDSW-24AT TaxID=2052957 RepID=UPI000C1ED76E|nr:DUF2948 family protein [Pseudorhodobacter sp. MZDSW-24AT]PJF11243.1 DUF2948 domain-containing protein [Pseudorhodobacter sp. MZDSW-24AT]